VSTVTPRSIFIDVEVDESVARDPELARKLTEVCPVDIFAQNDEGTLRIVDENLDECVLCYLCVEASPPDTVRIIKLYE
jgi:NAD-dependent dihydropyrimidine dehydrogenase PreA subunit